MDAFKKNTALFTIILALDQILKFLVEHYQPNLNFIIFSIRSVHNTGASFGILQGNNTTLIWVSIMALGFIMMNIKSITEKQTLPLTLITTGIIGNLIDRLFLGYVVDFFDLGWWPVFNVADSCIVIGVIWVILVLSFDKDEKIKEASNIKKRNKSNKRS